MFCELSILCVIIKVFLTSAEYVIYRDSIYSYTIQTKLRYDFTSAKLYCATLPNGQLAMIKDRKVAAKIEKKLHQIQNNSKYFCTTLLLQLKFCSN